jgi:hypothetical protein
MYTGLPNGDAQGETNSSHVSHRSDLDLEGEGSVPCPQYVTLMRPNPVNRQPWNVDERNGVK